MRRQTWASTAMCCLALAGALHYERMPCAHDEVQADVLGTSGYVCSPRCAEGTYDCPMDVPDGAPGKPQCMLQDVDKGAFCAVLCQVDSQCPSEAKCQTIAQANVGICTYPLSFTDWAHQSGSRKLSFGLPPRKASGVTPSMLSKAAQAIQNLKSKYNIQDGDNDVVAVKEFLASLAGGSVPPAGGYDPTASALTAAWPETPSGSLGLPSGNSAGSGLGLGLGLPALPGQSGAPPGSSSPPRHQGTAAGAWQHDFNYGLNNLESGLPGLERELHDTLWNIEHIEKRGVASNLMRGLIEFTILYLIIGIIYKKQMMGAEGIDMIPHIGFWRQYPELVVDGVAYAKILAGMDGSGGSGFAPMSGSAAERDSFSQFEPSRGT